VQSVSIIDRRPPPICQPRLAGERSCQTIQPTPAKKAHNYEPIN